MKLASIILAPLLFVALLVGWFFWSLPNIKQLETCFTTTMFQVKLCPTSAQYVKLKAISPYMVHAVIAAEDGSFYSHKGFDWHELKASLEANLSAGRYQRGGSTLTQQLAKNAFLTQDKSLLRKIREAYLAYQIEQHYKKDFILEKYLNVVEFGPNLFGIKAAARHYFQKSPAELTPLESAYLAHLLPNPKVYSRTFNRGQLTPFSQKMVGVILKRMNSFGKISAPAYQLSMQNLPQFPWFGITLADFEGSPGYSLDAPPPQPSDFDTDPVIDESTLEEIIQEDSGSAPPAAPASDDL